MLMRFDKILSNLQKKLGDVFCYTCGFALMVTYDDAKTVTLQVSVSLQLADAKCKACE